MLKVSFTKVYVKEFRYLTIKAEDTKKNTKMMADRCSSHPVNLRVPTGTNEG